MMKRRSVTWSVAALMLGLAGAVRGAGFAESFDEGKVPEKWVVVGDAGAEKAEAFKGGGSLRLVREKQDADAPRSATSPTFPLAAGAWEAGCALKGDMVSPDDSYRGVVELEMLDAGGKSVGRVTVGEMTGKKNWQAAVRRVDVADGVAAGRMVVRLEKALGRVWVDEMSVRAVAVEQRNGAVSKMVFSSGIIGNLLFPDGEKKTVVRVEASRELAAREITWVLRDYWGAEQGVPAKARLERVEGPKFVYHATIDLGSVPLALGKYYEVHADVADEGGAYHDYSSFAVLPEAEANRYPVKDVPFTSRSWENRVREHVELTRRLGIRLAGLRSEWPEGAPEKVSVAHLDLADKWGMGFLTGCPIPRIEQHLPGWEKLDEAALRAYARAFAEKCVGDREVVVNLGNEPHGDRARVKANVAAYRVFYEELKKAAPKVFVLGTAVGPEEEYFEEGFGKYCDAYDFHVYESYRDVRKSLAKYRAMFEKYGDAKPVWSTELGLNAQGMARDVIAAELVRKFSVFFAEGGGTVAWFGLCFPDAELKLRGTTGDAFNCFDGRYKQYAPRLDALAYYNMVNGVCVKKFVGEAHYPGEISAFLFRDSEARTLLVLWKEKGREDVTVPLPGVRKVKLVSLDGAWSELDAGEKSVTVTASEDPILLEYSGGGELPKALEKAATWVSQVPTAVKGVAADITLGGATGGVTVEAPFGWTVAGGGAALKVTPPPATAARAGNLVVRLGEGGVIRGQLALRVPVMGKVGLRLLPAVGGGVNVVVDNHGKSAEKVEWKVAVETQAEMAGGDFGKETSSGAYFTKPAGGTVTVPAGGVVSEVLPLAGVNPLARYQVRGTLTDSDGRVVTVERSVGGFIGAKRVQGAIALDGSLDEAAWAGAAEARIDQVGQFNGFRKAGVQWKGKEDLSGSVKFLWDDTHLYLAIAVIDDVFRNEKDGSSLWAGDSVQLLVDPAREKSDKPGKYDYVIGVGQKGPQAWCSVSADAGAPAGEAKDIRIAFKRGEAGRMTYEVAIPWTRIAPFKPTPGSNLGMAIGLNEDDGGGRQALMSWFGNVHTKALDSVGDIVLEK